MLLLHIILKTIGNCNIFNIRLLCRGKCLETRLSYCNISPLQHWFISTFRVFVLIFLFRTTIVLNIIYSTLKRHKISIRNLKSFFLITWFFIYLYQNNSWWFYNCQIETISAIYNALYVTHCEYRWFLNYFCIPRHHSSEFDFIESVKWSFST